MFLRQKTTAETKTDPARWTRHDWFNCRSSSSSDYSWNWKISFSAENHPHLKRFSLHQYNDHSVLEIFCHDKVTAGRLEKSFDTSDFSKIRLSLTVRINTELQILNLLEVLHDQLNLGVDNLKKIFVPGIQFLFKQVNPYYNNNKPIYLTQARQFVDATLRGKMLDESKTSQSPNDKQKAKVFIFTDFEGVLYSQDSDHLRDISKEAIIWVQKRIARDENVDLGDCTTTNIILAKHFNKMALQNLRELVQKILQEGNEPVIVPATCWVDSPTITLPIIKLFFPDDLRPHVKSRLINPFDNTLPPDLNYIKYHRYKKIIYWLDNNYKPNDKIIILSRITTGIHVNLLDYFVLCEGNTGLFDSNKLNEVFQRLENQRAYSPIKMFGFNDTFSQNEPVFQSQRALSVKHFGLKLHSGPVELRTLDTNSVPQTEIRSNSVYRP